MTIALSPAELEDLTARKRRSAQARQLEHLRIPFTPRTDGSLLVLRAHVEAITALASDRRDSKPEPQLRFDS